MRADGPSKRCYWWRIARLRLACRGHVGVARAILMGKKKAGRGGEKVQSKRILLDEEKLDSSKIARKSGAGPKAAFKTEKNTEGHPRAGH